MLDLLATLEYIKSRNANFDFVGKMDCYSLSYLGKEFRIDFPKIAVESLQERLKTALLNENLNSDLLDFLFIWANPSYKLWYLHYNSAYQITFKNDLFYLTKRGEIIKQVTSIKEFDEIFKQYVL